MKKNRFRISVIFATFIVLLSFTGCGKTKDDVSKDTEGKVTTEKEKGSEENSDIASPSETINLTLPEEIAVSDVNIKLKINETKKINAIVLPDKTDNKNVLWTSEDENIVTVKDGVLTGLSVGTCKVTVSSEIAPDISTSIIVEVVAGLEEPDNVASTTDADEVASETDAGEAKEEAAESTMHANGAGYNASANNDSNETDTGNNNTSANNGVGNNNSSNFNYEYCEEVLKLVNQVRAEVGVAPLVMDYSMQKASDVRGKEIVTLFEHTRPNGSICFTALDEAGISYMTAGENIAWGQRTPEEVMDSWINSEGHYKNIINPSYGRIAVSCYYDPNSDIASWNGCYWVQMFAD